MESSFADFAIPQDYDTEKIVLAELVWNPELIPAAMESVTADCFTSDKTKGLFATLLKMWEAREQIDIVTVSQRTDREFFHREILSKNSDASELSVRSHCAALRNIGLRRTLYFACLKGLQMATAIAPEEAGIYEFPAKLAEQIEKNAIKDTTVPLQSALNDLADSLASGATKRVPTGFPSLDRLTYGGWGPGDLVVLAARPSVGKTAFMLQMARGAARAGFPSLVLSLEMTNEQIARRMVFSTDQVTPVDIIGGVKNWEPFERAVRMLDGCQVYLDETPQTLDDVCSNITINVNRGRCKAAFIDYLQLMSVSTSNDSLYRQVTEMTKRLKTLAKRLRIPVILLAQLNRGSVSEKRAPQLHDLRDSGSIEQDADIVVMLDRPLTDTQEPSDRVNMYVRKNREGLAAGIEIELHSDRNYANFYEIVKDELSA